MTPDEGQSDRLSLSEFTNELARDLGEDPEEIEAHAEKFEIEAPWEADFEVVEEPD